MDINSLLSPQDSPASEQAPSPSPHSPVQQHAGRPNIQQRKSSSLSQQVTADQITSEPSQHAQYYSRTQHTVSQPLHSPRGASLQAQAAAGYAAQQADVARTAQTTYTRASPSGSSTPVSMARSPLQSRSPMLQHSALQQQPNMSRTNSTPQMDTLAGSSPRILSMYHLDS